MEIPEHLRERAQRARERVSVREHAAVIPLVRESDPELDRLLAEEEVIENGGLCTTVGDLREVLKYFTDETPLDGAHSVDYRRDHKRQFISVRKIF